MSSQRTTNAQTRGFIHDITSMMLQLKFFDASVTALSSTFKNIQMVTKQATTNERLQNTTLKQYLDDLGKIGQQRLNTAKQFGVFGSAGLKRYGNVPLTQLPKPLAPPQVTSTGVPITTAGFGTGGGIDDIIGANMGDLKTKSLGLGNILKTAFGDPLGSIGAVAKGTGGMIGKAASGVGTMFTKMTGLKAPILSGLSSAMGAMGGPAGMAAMVAVQVIMQLLQALNPFKDLMQALTDIFGVYGEILGTAFLPLIEKLFEVMLSPAVLEMVWALAGALMQIVIAFLPLIDILSPFATLLLSALIIPLQLLAPVISLLMIPLGMLGQAMSFFNAILQGIFSSWNTYVAPVFTALSGVFTAIGAFSLPDLSTAWSSFSTALVTGFTNFVRALVMPINNAITWINTHIIPGTANDIGLIALASGGVTNGPTLALIGDNKSGREKVTPLDEFGREQGGSSGITVNIYGNVTEDVLTETMKKVWLAKL